MKKLTRKEKIFSAKRQLSEFLKLRPEERLDNFFSLKHSVLRLYSIVFADGIPNMDAIDVEKLGTDHLLMDIELIPFYIDEKNTQSYIRYEFAKKLQYPSEDYEVLTPACGMYKLQESNEVLFSNRLAVDYTLESFAKRWYDKIPIILELIEKK